MMKSLSHIRKNLRSTGESYQDQRSRDVDVTVHKQGKNDVQKQTCISFIAIENFSSKKKKLCPRKFHILECK